MMAGEREEWLDIIKGMAIIAIVGGHVGMRNFSSLFCLISMFMVPVFFFSAGYVFKREQFPIFLIKKLKRIWLPFVVANFFILLVNNQFSFLNMRYGKPNLWEALKRTLRFDVVIDIGLPSWFLPVLFTVYIFYYFIYRITSIFRGKTQYIVIGIIMTLSALTGLVYIYRFNNFYYSGCSIIVNIILGMFCFFIGGVVKREKHFVDRLIESKAISFALFLGATILLKVISQYFEYSFDFRLGAVSGRVWVLIVIFVGLYWSLYFGKVCADYNGASASILAFIGRHTLSIVLLHMLCFQVVGAFQVYILKMQEDTGWPNVYTGNICWSLLATFVGIFLPVLFDHVLAAIKFYIYEPYAEIREGGSVDGRNDVVKGN